MAVMRLVLVLTVTLFDGPDPAVTDCAVRFP
jgi:hypothetical protein